MDTNACRMISRHFMLMKRPHRLLEDLQMAAEQIPVAEIAKTLSDEKVLIPAAYHDAHGGEKKGVPIQGSVPLVEEYCIGNP